MKADSSCYCQIRRHHSACKESPTSHDSRGIFWSRSWLVHGTQTIFPKCDKPFVQHDPFPVFQPHTVPWPVWAGSSGVRTERPASCSLSAVMASWTAPTRATRGPAAVSARSLVYPGFILGPPVWTSSENSFEYFLSLTMKQIFAPFWSTKWGEACPASDTASS